MTPALLVLFSMVRENKEIKPRQTTDVIYVNSELISCNICGRAACLYINGVARCKEHMKQ